MRSALFLILALGAAVIAAMPIAGLWSPWADAFASFLPLAAPLALAGLLIGWRKWRWAGLILSAFALAESAWFAAREWNVPHEPAGAGPRLVVVTHNLLNSNARPSETVDMLANSGADVILLQEAWGDVRAHLDGLARRYPYHSMCPGPCDLAIYSRLPMTPPEWKLRAEDKSAYGPPIMWARVTLSDGSSVMVAALHQHWPIPPGLQQLDREQLVTAMARLGEPTLVLGGDFNLTPWSSGMRELDENMPSLRRITRGLFSFPSHLGGVRWPVPILPIDHIFVGPKWRVIDVRRLPATGSDHYPIRAELELSGR